MVDSLSHTPEHQKTTDVTPPPSPPPFFDETKLSKKRVREVSLEPVVTPDLSTLREPKDTVIPSKKNRTIFLDPTEEEDDGPQSRSASASPPLRNSPQEMKIQVRQISRGVEVLSWKKLVTHPVKDFVDLRTTEEINEAQNTFSEVINKNNTGLTEIDNSYTEREIGDKVLKRKFLDRGSSLGPLENDGGNVTTAEPAKRPRDDAEQDDNPRESRTPSPAPDDVGHKSSQRRTPTPSKCSPYLENEETQNASVELLKMPWDDNPRDAKRRSPPPEQKSPKSQKLTTPSVPSKLSGFMSYASSSSPFADVRGQNIFTKSSMITPLLASTLSIQNSPLAASASRMEAFTSSSSLFTSATRSKSPVSGTTSKLGRAKSPGHRGQTMHSNAFSPYAVGMQSFSASSSKRARAGSPISSLERNGSVLAFGSNEGGYNSEAEDVKAVNRPTTFSEKLRASRDEEEENRSDEESRFVLTEQSVLTGEEDDETIHQVRGKLFLLSGAQWKERGTGTLRLNVRRSDGRGARLVMRKEAVYSLLLNVTLFHGMQCFLAQDPRYLRFSVFEDGSTRHYNMKLANAKIAKELLEEINANIPDAS